MTDLPALVGYGRVTYTRFAATPDSADALTRPDSATQNGTVLFTPSVSSVIRYTTGAPPFSLDLTPVVCNLVAGQLVSPMGEAWVDLVAASPVATPPDLMWTALIVAGGKVDTIPFALASGAAIDLTNYASGSPAPASPATIIGPQGVPGPTGPQGSPGPAGGAITLGTTAGTAAEGNDPRIVNAVSSKLPRTTGSANGLKYDGTDESAAFQALLNKINAAGGGELVLEGVVRCDSQVVLPTSVVDTRLRMAPLRITGQAASASGAWPPFTGQSAYPSAGLDLRYTGRTDAGCATTLGSAFVTNSAAVPADRGLIVTGPGIADQTWILHVKPGVGWVTTKAARATGSGLSLTSFGGRIQGFGYGTFELDHCQIMNNGAPSSAPFGLTTGPCLRVHDNTFIGHASKEYELCDEDPWVLGGPGQGTILTAPLPAGIPVTTLPVAPTPVQINGSPISLGVGTASARTVNPTGNVAAGATSIPVVSFTPSATIPADTSVYIGNSFLETSPTSYNVPAAQFQGYPSHIQRNHFTRIRRIVAGGYATDIYIDGNAWMHNTGSNLAAAPSTLTTDLIKGTAYTSLAVSALSRAVNAGDVIQIGVGDIAQEAIASVVAAIGATSVTVNSFTANAAYAVGTKAFNSTVGIGAMVESYATDTAANAITVTNNRMGFSGGYTHATRYAGFTIHSNILSNNFQDYETHPNNLAGHRFDRNAKNNVVVAGLASGFSPVIDDWARVEGPGQQALVKGSESHSPEYYSPSFIANATTADQGAHRWADGGAVKWQLYKSFGDARLYLRDVVNGVMFLVMTPGATVDTSDCTIRSNTNIYGRLALGPAEDVIVQRDTSGQFAVNKAVKTQATTTALRPTATSVGAGGQIYDTTLTKPIWSDGAVWRDAAGTAV